MILINFMKMIVNNKIVKMSLKINKNNYTKMIQKWDKKEKYNKLKKKN